MNYDEIVAKKRSVGELTKEERSDYNLFLAYVKNGDFDIALYFSKEFIDEKFISEHIDKILETFKYVLPNNICDSIVIRDELIRRGNYDLLVSMAYRVLRDITDEELISKLNEAAEKNISEITLYEYTFIKLLKEKKYDLIPDNYFISNNEIVDEFYDDLLIAVDLVKISSDYLFIKCLLNGDFDHGLKVNGYIDDDNLHIVVTKYFDRVLDLCKDKIIFPFGNSIDLFNYYHSLGDYKKLIQFSSDLLTKEFIDKYENEILNAFNVDNFNAYNRSLFDLLYKNGKYELCGLFKIKFKDDELDTIGRVIIRYVKDFNSYYGYLYAGNKRLLEIACEEGRFDLVPYFNLYIFDDNIIDKYGDSFISYFDRNNLPYMNNPRLLLLFFKHSIYEICDKYSGKLPQEILETEYFVEYLKRINGRLPYSIDRTEYVLIRLLEIGRTDLVDAYDSIFECCTDEFLDKYGSKLAEELDYVPYHLTRNAKYYSLVAKAKKLHLLNSFYLDDIPEDLYDVFIDTVKENNTYACRIICNPKGLETLLAKNRYDLIDNYILSVDGILTSEILDKYAIVLIEKFYSRGPIKENSYLLKYVIEHDMKKYIEYFSIVAYDDEIIDKYGNELLDIIVKKLNEYDVSHLGIHTFMSNQRLLSSSKLLFFLINNNVDVPFDKFDNKLFTNDIIDKYFDLLLNFIKKERLFLVDNVYFFEKLIECGEYKDFVWLFNSDIFTKEIIDKYFDIFISLLKEEKKVYYNLSNNAYLLKRIIEMGDFDIIFKFNNNAFSKDIVDSYYDQFLSIIKNNRDVVPNCFFNEHFFDRFFKDGLYNYVKQFGYASKFASFDIYLVNYFDSIVSIVREDYESPFARDLLGSSEFIKMFIKICSIEEIKYIDINLFNRREFTIYYDKLVQWIINYNNGCVPNELIQCGELKKYCKENNISDLYLHFTFIDDPSLGVSSIDFDSIVNEYAPLLGMEPKVLEEKLKFLYSKNDEIFNTLFPLMLKDRMNIIDVKHLLTICIYPDLQYVLITLNDNELKLIDKLLDIIDMESYDTSNVLYNVLKNLKYYKNIINGIDNLNEEQLENFVYILQRQDNIFGIYSADDLLNVNFYNKIQKLFKDYDDKLESSNYIIEVKKMLLLKKYGFDFEEAAFIVKRYCSNINFVLKSDLDENLKRILIDLNDILECSDIERLKFLYSTSDLLINDFRSVVYLEAYIRSEYAKLYDKTLYKIDDKDELDRHRDLITNPEALERINNINYNGKKPKLYYLTEDFNLQIHALGAYSGYSRPSSFLDDWNRPKMISHGVCTSYIGNNQIANARAYHPILGFDSIGDSDLLLAANYDIGSSSANVSFNTSREMPTDFLPPEEMINQTRHTHNEMVIERMKYIDGVAYKRMPSYVVYLVDDINNKYNFMTRKDLIEEFKNSGKSAEAIKLLDNSDTYFIRSSLDNGVITVEDAKKIAAVFYYEEVVQASIDMNIPIVIVDRLLFAKKESKKCDVIFDSLVSSKDPNYITLLLLTYFNNVIGCVDYNSYDYEYCKYFNDDGFDALCVKLLSYIDTINDNDVKLNHLEVLLNSIKNEIEKSEKDINGDNVLAKYVNIINDKIDGIKKGVTDDYDGKGY